MSGDATKHCRKCDRILPVECFTPIVSGRGVGGHRSQCKECRKSAFTQWQKNNRVRHCASSKAYRDRQRELVPPKTHKEKLSEVWSKADIAAKRAEAEHRLNVIVSMGWQDGQTIREIAAAAKVSPAKVSLALDRLGLRKRVFMPKPSVGWEQRVIELRRSGLTQNDVAHELGIGTYRVIRVCRKAGLMFKQGPKPRDYSHIQSIPLDQLQSVIIKPGFEKHLTPLLAYKGSADLGRVHRLWNLLVAMREAECETISDATVKFCHNPEFTHLCGPASKPQYTTLIGFTSRVINTTKMQALDAGIYDYARLLNPRPYHYDPISEISHRRDHAWWRHFEVDPNAPKRVARERILKPAPLSLPSYPFLIHEGNRPEHELLKLINDAVPRSLPFELRADICQDLAVGILCGDFDKENLSLPVKEMTKRVMKMFPLKYGDLSLDAPIPGTEDLRLIDVL